MADSVSHWVGNEQNENPKLLHFYLNSERWSNRVEECPRNSVVPSSGASSWPSRFFLPLAFAAAWPWNVGGTDL